MNQYFENAILKWISILVFAFIVFLIVATVLAYQQGAFASSAYASDTYEFVYCHNEVTNTTITYPEGTKCDAGYANNDDDEDEDEDNNNNREVNRQEEKAMKEARK